VKGEKAKSLKTKAESQEKQNVKKSEAAMNHELSTMTPNELMNS